MHIQAGLALSETMQPSAPAGQLDNQNSLMFVTRLPGAPGEETGRFDDCSTGEHQQHPSGAVAVDQGANECISIALETLRGSSVVLRDLDIVCQRSLARAVRVRVVSGRSFSLRGYKLNGKTRTKARQCHDCYRTPPTANRPLALPCRVPGVHIRRCVLMIAIVAREPKQEIKKHQ